MPASQLSLTLVDHNFPTGPMATFVQSVVAILDHHEDFGGNLPNLKSKKIEMVGSCTTLVAECFLTHPTLRDVLGRESVLRSLLEGVDPSPLLVF